MGYRNEDWKDRKKRRKEIPLCSYCNLNKAKADGYCCGACERHDREYREWLERKK